MKKIKGVELGSGISYDSVTYGISSIMTPDKGDITPKMKKILSRDDEYQRLKMKVKGSIVLTFTFDPDTIEGLNKHLSRKKFKTVMELDECINKYIEKQYPNYVGVLRDD